MFRLQLEKAVGSGDTMITSSDSDSESSDTDGGVTIRYTVVPYETDLCLYFYELFPTVSKICYEIVSQT